MFVRQALQIRTNRFVRPKDDFHVGLGGFGAIQIQMVPCIFREFLFIDEKAATKIYNEKIYIT